MSWLTGRAGRTSRVLAVLAAVAAFGGSALYSWSGLGVGAVGLILVAVGVFRGANEILSLGAFGLVAGALFAGVEGAPPIPVLVAVISAILAWDFGGTAIDLDHQLGEHASTIRLEVVHAGGSVLAGLVTAGIGYGLFMTGPGEQPLSAVFFLVIAAILLVVALR